MQSPAGSSAAYWIQGTSALVLAITLLVMEAAWFLSAFRGEPVLTRAVAALVILTFAGLTGLEYPTGASLGIDEQFVRNFLPVQTSSLGRMSPITLVCHLLLGGYLAVNSFQRARALLWIGNFLPSLSLVLSCIAILGYTLHIEAGYGWGILTKMAFHTAVALFLLSLSAFIHSFSKAKRGACV
jgi:hypothetical protein